METPGLLEIAANLLVAASIVLAARNSIHVWWTGIVGCALFAIVFWESRLYGDMVLQGFFIVASVVGWWHWLKGDHGGALHVRWTPVLSLAGFALAGAAFATAWAFMLARYTDAASPIADSIVLCLSVVAQLLMMGRRVENWLVWVAVNSVAVPLFWSRGLHLTAFLYAFYWFNAWWGFLHWKRLVRA